MERKLLNEKNRADRLLTKFNDVCNFFSRDRVAQTQWPTRVSVTTCLRFFSCLLKAWIALETERSMSMRIYNFRQCDAMHLI